MCFLPPWRDNVMLAYIPRSGGRVATGKANPISRSGLSLLDHPRWNACNRRIFLHRSRNNTACADDCIPTDMDAIKNPRTGTQPNMVTNINTLSSGPR